MKLQILCSKTMLRCSQNVNSVLQSIWKKFSTSSIACKKKPECCEPVGPGPKIIVPLNCKEEKPPIADPSCKVAIIIGGSNNGFGYSAAEQLLSHGAKRVILADCYMDAGTFAVEKLCKAYGKDRAKFYPCDVRNSCQIEGVFTSSHCREESPSILFNDLDAIYSAPDSSLNYCIDAASISNVMRLTKLAMEHLSRDKEKAEEGRIVINCASILGFMGWPNEPEPIYCKPEPTVETTVNAAKEYPMEQSGVRIVALCPSTRAIEFIGLPDLPDDSTVRRYTISDVTCQPVSCLPDPRKDRTRLGRALVHLMARAETGSVWLLEPPFTLRETPRLIRFPEDGKPAEPAKKDCPHGISKREASLAINPCNCP